MMFDLPTTIFCLGIGQLSVLIASALVPVELRWTQSLAELPTLMRQLFWVYGGYVVLSIISLSAICLTNSQELSSGSGLARSFCLYGAAFWALRLSLQPFLAAKPFLRTWWLQTGYHLLSVFFASFVFIYGWAAIH